MVDIYVYFSCLIILCRQRSEMPLDLCRMDVLRRSRDVICCTSTVHSMKCFHVSKIVPKDAGPAEIYTSIHRNKSRKQLGVCCRVMLECHCNVPNAHRRV